MAEWEPIRRRQVRADLPMVSFDGPRLTFNKKFWLAAEMKDNRYVEVAAMDDEMKVLFKFLATPSPDSFTVGGQRNQGRTKIIPLYERQWVRAVADLGEADLRKFPASEVPGNNCWAIQLRPSFEHSATSIEEIPSSAVGIYRYLDNQGDVIYIGKGKVRTQARQPKRQDWTVDRYEWSVIEDEEAQFKWENFWILDYKAKHGGQRPRHNHNDGIPPSEDK